MLVELEIQHFIQVMVKTMQFVAKVNCVSNFGKQTCIFFLEVKNKNSLNYKIRIINEITDQISLTAARFFFAIVVGFG